jgi:hypothetical protein
VEKKSKKLQPAQKRRWAVLVYRDGKWQFDSRHESVAMAYKYAEQYGAKARVESDVKGF